VKEENSIYIGDQKILATIIWLAVFLDSRLKYASLEPLIKFIEFLVQNVCQKYSKYVRNVPGD